MSRPSLYIEEVGRAITHIDLMGETPALKSEAQV